MSFGPQLSLATLIFRAASIVAFWTIVMIVPTWVLRVPWRQLGIVSNIFNLFELHNHHINIYI